jgi:hypothetical protein
VSQYPSPYQQPPAGGGAGFDFSQYVAQGAPSELLAPARRAGVLMIVLGALIAMLGTCNGASAYVMTPEQYAEQQAAMKATGLPESPQLDMQMMHRMTIVMGAVTLVVGLAMVVDGVQVFRGSRIAVNIGLFLAGGLTLLLGLMTLVMLLGGLMAPMMFAFACVFALPTGMFVWLMYWLYAAAKNNSRLAMVRQQYQQQFAQYGKYQQAYAMNPGMYGMPYAPAGYGYAYPQQMQPQMQSPPSGGGYATAPAPQTPATDKQTDTDDTPPPT